MVSAELVLAGVAVALLLYLVKAAYSRPHNFPPGPPALPIWGSYPLLLLENYKFPYRVLDAMTRRYKSKVIGFYFGSYPAVAACDHQSVKEVLSNPHMQGRVINVLGDVRNYHKDLGIFLSEGPQWLEQRRLTLRHMRDFGFGRRSARLEAEIEAELRDLLELIGGDRKDEAVTRQSPGGDGSRRVLLPEALFPTFINSILAVYTGARLPRSADETARRLGKAGIRFQRHGDTTGGFLTIHSWLARVAPVLSGYWDGLEGSLQLRSFLEKLIEDHKNTYEDGYERGFIDTYLREIKQREHTGEPTPFTTEQLAIILLDMFFPSATALTSAVTWALIYVAHHPAVMRRVQRELDAVVGRGRAPSLDDRPHLPYTEATLKEVMRINTPAPISVPHKVTEDTSLQGYSLPKGSVVITCLWSMHMDKDVWGDPENFRPERFLDENGQLSRKDFSLPFGAGKRLCAGETFARQNMFLAFSTLLQSFSLAADGAPPLGCNIPGNVETQPSFWARFQAR
ncbi:probable cytochrome P450 304a1 [Schistocerca cancellata]|uniref:probable cytochrome P450 304a1 n=1 Tax=Schistocerca cancellata TaxID=274614 RepID=UPI0021189B4E|nr:probable cytochrome P450 304a1 [Schistocerca cancellata]